MEARGRVNPSFLPLLRYFTFSQNAILRSPNSFVSGQKRSLNTANYCNTNISTVVHCPCPLLRVRSLNMCHFSQQETYLCEPLSITIVQHKICSVRLFKSGRGRQLATTEKSIMFFFIWSGCSNNKKTVLFVNEVVFVSLYV